MRISNVCALLLLAPLAAGCGATIRQYADGPTPVAVTETLSGTLTPNGGRTHEFVVQQAGTVTVKLSALAPDDTVNDRAQPRHVERCRLLRRSCPTTKRQLNTTVTGSAQQTGLFCARVYDAAGSLTASTDYTVDITHF
jgi:hypothetical protein